MAQQFRPWAENDDIRDQAEASLEQGQQQIAAQEDASLTTRQQQWNLNEEKRRAYEDQVRAAEQRRQQPGISPQAWEAASRTLSGEDRAAARQAELQARQDQSLLEDSAIRLQQQEIDRQAEQERLAAAQEREQAAQDAIATRQHRAAGGATHTDPVTGRSTITRHEDGAPAFDAGPVGDPRVEEARTRSDFAAGILGGSGDGALGATGGTQAKATGVQDFRDDRGNVATLPIEEKTDPATGETYVETKDQFGRPKRLTTGTDQKVKRTLQLDLEYDQLQAVRGNLELQAQQIAPNYQAAADAFAAAQRKYNVAPKYIQVAGKWVENGVIPADPDEQRKWVQTQIPADPIKLAAWQRERQMDRQAYEIAKRNHDKSAPAWNNLQQQIETAKSREAQIRVAKKRLALGLPEDDGGLAESLVALENGTVTTREQAVNTYLADLPADTRARLTRGLDPKFAGQPGQPPIDPTTGEPEPLAEHPAVPQDDPAAVALFTSAFSAIPGAESLTIGETGKTYRTLRRDGTTIGAIYTDPENGAPFIALNEFAGSDLAPMVNLDAPGGLRVYLKERIGDRQSPAKESAWAAGIYQTLQDPLIQEDEQAQAAYLREQQATPTDLINRVRQGEVSVQTGSRLLRDLYGVELTTGDYNDPALFQKWLQEESARQLREDVWLPQDTVAAKWQRATKDRLSFSEQENIRNDYAAHYALTNPLLTRDQQKALYAQNARHDASTMDRVRSFVNATKKFAAEDVFGSSIGIVAGIGEDLSYAGASALSESARETLAEKMRLRGMSTAAWAQGVERFAKTLATKEGREAAAQRDLAMREWQAAVDAAHGQPEPDQAAIDAAKQKAIAATLRLHNLARDEGSPIEAHHLDPAQDRALRMAMDRYVATADPRAWASLDARMLMSNDRRWVSAEMEELAGGQGGFLGAVNRARYAGFEEVGSEALSWFTLGAFGAATKGGKALNAAMKGNRAYQASRIGKIGGSISTALQKAAVNFDNLGKAAGTLEKSLTTAQRMGNTTLRGAKIAAIGGATEGSEEAFVELGADDPELLKTFALGAAGGVMMLPIGVMQAGIGGAVASHQQQARLQQRYAEYAREYNRINRDLPGFEDIDAKTAEFASLFVNPQEREAGLQQLGAEMSGIQEFLAIENSAQAAGQTPGPEVAAMEQRLASLEAVSTSLAEMDVAAIDAVSGFAKLDAQDKVNLVAYAKAAAGRADLLTPQERKAIQAKNTEAGAPVFQGDAVTPEGMAMLVEQYPVLGKLPQFQAAAPQPAPLPEPAGTMDQANQPRVQVAPEQQQQAEQIAAQVEQQVAAEFPAIAAKLDRAAPSTRVSGGVIATATADGGIRISVIPEDIAQSIANGMTPQQAAARLKDDIVLHETIHALGFQVAASQQSAAGDTATPDKLAQNFYAGMHAQMAAESPQMLANGRALYAENNDGSANGWDTLPEWAQAAEVVRMLAEAKIAGRTTDIARLTEGASPSLIQKLAQIVRDMIEAITTGQVPESVKQHVDTLTDLYNQLVNATPTPNPSRPNPADNPSQPAPGQPGAGNRQSAEKDGNRRPPGDGRTGQTPVDDAGASAQSAEEIAQAAAKAEYDLALKARPLLKKDLELMSALRIAAMEARVAATADPQNATRIAKDAIGKFLQDPYVSERLGSMEMENRAKAKEYRRQSMARVNAEADRIIAGIDLIRTLLGYVGRIEGKPANLGLIRQKRDAAKKDPNITLTPEEQAIADKYLTGNYDQMPTVGDFPGSGKNAVAAAIVRKIFTEPGSGVEPDVAASAEDMAKFNLQSGNDLMVAIADALRNYVNGTETSDLADPNADTSGMTDEQIEAMLQREARAQNLSRWKGITRREGLTSSTADAYQAELATLADAAGHSLDEGGNVVDAFGDFIPPEDLAALQQEAVATVDERNAPKPKTETREDLDKVQTDGSTAALNPRVEGLEDQSVPRGDLSGKTQPLSTAALQAIQRNGSGITAPPTDGPLKKAVDAFAAKAQAMMPMFQGNKVQMAKYVASAILRYWTKAQREAVTTFYDLFAGGGAWGLVLADTFFPNVKKFVINEFDTPRSIKVREQMVNGHRFAEVIQNKDTQIIIRGILQDYYARAKGVTWGGIYVQFEKWAEQNAGKFDDTTVAIIKMLADDSTLGAPASWGTLQEEIGKELDGRPVMQRRGPNAEEVTKWFLGRHAKWAETIHQTYQRMVDRGVDFTFRNGDAYTMDVDRGRHVFVTADPPYFATTGYDDSIVGPGMYASTRDLMRRLTGQDNNVAYTDEAWWIKDSINDKITDADLVEGAEIATQIAKTLDFMVVAGKIESRYETLGLHNPAGSPVAPGRTANPDGNAVRPDGGNLQQEGRGPDGRGTAGDVAPGPVAEARLQPAAADLKNLPVGTVVRSKAYASEGNITIEKPLAPRADGTPAYQAGTTGGRVFTITPDQITSVVSTPGDTRLGSAPATPRIRRSIGELESLAKSQEDFRFWFQDFRGFLEDFLGPNKDYAPLVSEFLNATSAASTVGSNVVAMMKALREYIETGTFVSDFLPAHLGNLHRAQSGQVLSGPKISEYSDAIFGIETAVPVDRHIAQLLFNTVKPTAAQIRAAKIRVAKVGLRLGWTPRQTMAALWAANIAKSGRTPQSYERYLQKHRFEIRRLLSADRQGNQRGLKASRRIAARIEQRRGNERAAGGLPAGSEGLNGRPAVQTQDGRTLEAPGPVTLMSPAYHGTPHKIDLREGFRLDRIGTGEGAQAYGWGLYFAESMGVAKSYVSAGKNESARNLITLIQEESAYYVPSKKWYGKQLSREESDVELAKNFFKKYLKQFPNTKVTEEVILDVIKNGIDNVNPEIFGNLYKVDLKPAEDEYLDWDKPLSEQSEKVLNAIRRIPADLAIDLLDAPGFYKNEAVVWARKMGWIDAGITNPEGASKYLHALGIRGIRYLDGNSRGNIVSPAVVDAKRRSVETYRKEVESNPGDQFYADQLRYAEQDLADALRSFDGGSYNYVIFDEADIEITEVNGQPVDAASLFSAPVTAPDMRPLTPDRLWGEWAASTTEPGILIGYRGENGNGKADNGFGSSEGVGLYLAKTEEDTAFFGKAREVKFPKPKRPLIVDEQAGVEALPLLDEESPVWSRIFSHQPRPGDSDWIKAHTLAAKQIGLTEDTWVEKIDAFPRALTDKLLAMGYDAVYTRSGGMEWVTLLAKPGQRFNRGTRSEGGTALYSAPARMADPRQLAFEFRDKPSEYLLDMRQVDSQPLPESARQKAYATMRDTLDQWNDIDSPTPNLSYIDDVRKYLGTAQEAAAAVRSYVTAGFTDMATMPDHPASKALQRALSLFPDRKPARMIRSLGFPTQAAAMAYVRDFKPGAVAVQARQFASWSEANDQWEDSEGYDLPSMMSMQQGEYTVTLRVTPGVPAKDISLATTGQDFDKGVELVTQKGTQMRVKSVARDGQNWIVYMEGLSRPSKRAQALFSAPVQNPAYLAKSLLDSIGEQALRVEQPGKSYEDKRQLILDFSKSLLPAEGAAAVPDRPLGPVSVLRARVAGTVAADLRVKFIGETIEGLEDLVEKAQVLRNPGFETFYLLATRIDNGKAKVLDAMAVTSRVPLSSAIFERNKSWDEGVADHVAFLRNAGADSYILLHNHPAGDPSPSAADIRVTREHARRMDAEGFELIDHVVINHLTYATLDANGIVSRGQIQSDAVDPYPWPVGTEIGMEGDGPVKIAAIAKNIQEAKDRPDLLVGFFLNSDLKIVASVQGSAQDIKKLTRSQLQEIGRRQGGHMFVLHGQAANRQEAMRLMRELAPMNQSGLLTDAIIELRDSDQFLSGEDTSFFRQSEDGIFPAKTPGERVQQTPAAQYRYLKAKQEKAGLTPAEEQALLRAEQAMGQTMAFDMDDPALRARRGSVSPAFQPQLKLETQHPITGRQLSLFSAPAQSDPEYLAAVEAGDMKTAQRMVDEAAYRSLPTIPEDHLAVLHKAPEELIKSIQQEGLRYRGILSNTAHSASSWADLDLVGGLDGRWSTVHTGKEPIAVLFVPIDEHNQHEGRRGAIPTGVVPASQIAHIIPRRDPVTYDAQGNVIPLSQRFNRKSDSILYSAPAASLITSELDAYHMDAVENGDMETAQRLVHQASLYAMGDPIAFLRESNGDRMKMYHGSGHSDHTVFSLEGTPHGGRIRPERVGRGIDKLGFWFTSSESQGKAFSFVPGKGHGKTYSVYLDIRNPLVLRSLKEWNDWIEKYALHHGNDADMEIALEKGGRSPAGWFNADLVRERLRLGGKDGIIIIDSDLDGRFGLQEKEEFPTWAIALDPSQIKSADPVTYDAQGNVIPLSQRFNQESDSILYSPAAQPDDQAALEAALRGLDPIYGDVLKASMESPTPTPEALADRFNLPVRAIHNIIGTVRARIQAQARTIRPGGLQPARTADGRLKGGMPQRGNSTVPHLAAVDQLQQQEGLPLSKTNREIHDAGRRLAARPDALDHLLAAQRSGAPTAEQIAATAHYLREASVRGDQSAKLTELAILYREQGTRQSEEFRARIDQYHTPSERNALIFQEMLTAPNKKVRKAYEDAKTPEAKLAILEAWNAKVKGIKEAMKNRGIDLDAALARLAEQRANVQAGEAYASEAHQKLVDSLNAEVASLRQQLAAAQEGPAKDAAQAKLDTAEQNAAKAAELDPRNTIRLELEKLRPDERAVIETLRETQDWATAAARGFMDIRDVKRLVDRFQDAIATAGMQAILLAEDILLDRQATLQAPADNAPDRVKEAFRLAMAMTKVATGIDPDAINRKAAGKPPKSTRQKKADAGPEPAMMTDEQFAAYQNNPQTWRPLWQAEAALTGQRLTFEEWQARPETQALKQRQERMFKQPVSTFTGELDMQDPISVKRAFDALNIHNASLFDKAMEFWRTSILSGPQTAIVNFGGNVAHSLYQLGPRRILEAGVNNVLGIIGLGSKDAATMGELRVMAKQVHKALGKAGSDMLRSWNMDDRVVEAEVLALGKQVEFSGVGADYSPQAMGGPIGSIMRGISFRHMTAADEFLKSFHAHVEVAAHAYRMAKAEGLKGDAMEARMEELMKYGSQAWQRAYNSAEWVTFQSRPDQSDRRAISFLDRFAKGIRRFAQTDTGRTKEIVKIDRDGKLRREVVPIMRPNAFSFFFPFINTPLNIFKIGIEMSPIGAFFSLVDASRALRERLDKGHLTPQAAKAAAAELYDKQRLVQDITNQLIGAGLFWALGTLVKPDDEDELPFITGSVDWKRTSRGDRDVRQRVMPAYSIRIGDAIFSYQRVEPFGTALGFLVDARLAFEKNGATDAALGEFMTTAINQMDNKTYLQGVSDIFNLIHDPSRFGSKVAGNLATGFVPNLIRQPIREADPYVRDTRPAAEDGFMEAIAKRIGYSLAPGYAPPMLDVWGNPLLRNPGAKLLGSPITDIPLRVFDPTQLTVAKEIDPIDRYIFNWNNSQADQKARFNIEPIQDTLVISRNGTSHKVAISQEDHLQANRNAGQAARAVLGNDWNPVQPTEQGIERIKDVVRTFQKRERDRLRAKYAATLPVE